MHQYKYEFNQRLLTLRDKKIHVIAEIKDAVNQLQEIQKKLDMKHHLPIPAVVEMQPDEVPER